MGQRTDSERELVTMLRRSMQDRTGLLDELIAAHVREAALVHEVQRLERAHERLRARNSRFESFWATGIYRKMKRLRTRARGRIRPATERGR